MKKLVGRTALLCLGLLLALVLGEIALRLLPAKEAMYEHHNEDAEGNLLDVPRASARGLLKVVNDGPRPRETWAPNLRFFMCYKGGKRPYMDAKGRVEVKINPLGIRDRDELTLAKPQGEYRIVCVGDSFTFGWGIPAELAWPRLLEHDLAKRHKNVRTINCGAAGAVYLDEYCAAVKMRFLQFEPDLVIVTLCLNDIAVIPGAVILKRGPVEFAPRRWSKLVDLVCRWYDHAHELEIDRIPDPGRALLDAAPDNPLFAQRHEPHELFWAAGKSRAALTDLRDWCAQKNIRLAVVVWPLMQGLENGAFYPFEALHDAVREFCAAEKIAFLDLLPAFRGQDSRSLWVDPSDPHANEIAQRVAAPALSGFVESLRCLPRN